MYRSFPRVLLTCALLLLGLSYCLPATAKKKDPVQDSLKSVIADQRAALAHADSIGEPLPRIEGRMALAGLLPTPEAILLLRSASALADSMELLSLEIRSRTVLASLLNDAGKSAEAYKEATTLLGLEQRSAAQARDSSQAVRSALLAESEAAIDSTNRAGAALNAALALRLHQEGSRSRLWMWIAIASCAIFLAVLAWLLQRMGRVSRKLHQDISSLQVEVNELQRARNRKREEPATEKAIGTDPGPRSATSPPYDLDAAMDPIVLAMFRKSAPERLLALRAARTSTDNDKVVRVVHSMRPQLVSFDTERFAPLCAAITAPNTSADTKRWNMDLDTFEHAVEELLNRTAH